MKVVDVWTEQTQLLAYTVFTHASSHWDLDDVLSVNVMISGLNRQDALRNCITHDNPVPCDLSRHFCQAHGLDHLG